MYFTEFGAHPDFFKFCRKLRDLQEAQENEELQYLRGGHIPARMSASCRSKEEALFNLRRIFENSAQTEDDAYTYVTSVASKMRKYNLSSNDIDYDD